MLSPLPLPLQLKTTTTAAASRDFTEDRLWLNGKEADVGHPRVQACLREGECPVPSLPAQGCPRCVPAIP